MHAHAQPTWRTPVFYRIFFPAVGLYFLFGTVAYFDGGEDLWGTVLGLVMGLAFTLGPFRPVVRLEQQDVFARGLVFSRRMPLGDVVEIEGGYGGLNFVMRNGDRFEATGVGEKMNITVWRGRRGKADSIADIIFAAREQALTDVSEHERPTKPRPLPELPLPSYVKIVQGIGTAVFLLGAYLAFISDTLVAAGLPLMVVGTAASVLVLLLAQKRSARAADSD